MASVRDLEKYAHEIQFYVHFFDNIPDFSSSVQDYTETDTTQKTYWLTHSDLRFIKSDAYLFRPGSEKTRTPEWLDMRLWWSLEHVAIESDFTSDAFLFAEYAIKGPAFLLILLSLDCHYLARAFLHSIVRKTIRVDAHAIPWSVMRKALHQYIQQDLLLTETRKQPQQYFQSSIALYYTVSTTFIEKVVKQLSVRYNVDAMDNTTVTGYLQALRVSFLPENSWITPSQRIQLLEKRRTVNANMNTVAQFAYQSQCRTFAEIGTDVFIHLLLYFRHTHPFLSFPCRVTQKSHIVFGKAFTAATQLTGERATFLLNAYSHKHMEGQVRPFLNRLITHETTRWFSRRDWTYESTKGNPFLWFLTENVAQSCILRFGVSNARYVEASRRFLTEYLQQQPLAPPKRRFFGFLFVLIKAFAFKDVYRPRDKDDAVTPLPYDSAYTFLTDMKLAPEDVLLDTYEFFRLHKKTTGNTLWPLVCATQQAAPVFSLVAQVAEGDNNTKARVEFATHTLQCARHGPLLKHWQHQYKVGIFDALMCTGPTSTAHKEFLHSVARSITDPVTAEIAYPHRSRNSSTTAFSVANALQERFPLSEPHLRHMLKAECVPISDSGEEPPHLLRDLVSHLNHSTLPIRELQQAYRKYVAIIDTWLRMTVQPKEPSLSTNLGLRCHVPKVDVSDMIQAWATEMLKVDTQRLCHEDYEWFFVHTQMFAKLLIDSKLTRNFCAEVPPAAVELAQLLLAHTDVDRTKQDSQLRKRAKTESEAR